MKDSLFNKEYIAPTLTIDMVIFQITNNRLNVLLTKRAQRPFKSTWALPGGYNAAGQTTLEAADAIMHRKVGLDIHSQLVHIEQLYTFDTVARDPRGHAVAVVYSGYGREIELDSPNQTAQFFDVSELPKLAFDHAKIIDYALQRLRNRIGYTNLAQAFLPKQFTLTSLQDIYQAVLDKPLDKRNFRKRITSLDMIHDTGRTTAGRAHRPAKLYAFNSTNIAVVDAERF
ncbi:MAG: NUDIX hydrolase [Candidatus Nomurabacteria bacterium]|jgi:8-oxo-dGTP diphosphatase|nr:NUDIX hydrolase [Candidatus Nomurabacteria bacterium]